MSMAQIYRQILQIGIHLLQRANAHKRCQSVRLGNAASLPGIVAQEGLPLLFVEPKVTYGNSLR